VASEPPPGELHATQPPAATTPQTQDDGKTALADDPTIKSLNDKHATADFDAALKINPRLTSSLYGRGLARRAAAPSPRVTSTSPMPKQWTPTS
jgi:hypothetical protein